MINRVDTENNNGVVNTSGKMPFRVVTPYIYILKYHNSMRRLLSLSSYTKDTEYGFLSVYNILFYKYKKSILQIKKR